MRKNISFLLLALFLTILAAPLAASADDAANVDNGSADSHTQAPESGAGAETVSTSTDEDAQQPVSPAHPTHDSKEHDIAADGEVRSDT